MYEGGTEFWPTLLFNLDHIVVNLSTPNIKHVAKLMFYLHIGEVLFWKLSFTSVMYRYKSLLKDFGENL